MHFWLDICHYIPIEIRVPISPTEGWDMLPTDQKNRQYSLESNDPTWMCIPLSKWMYIHSYSSYILPYGGELTMVMTIEPTPHLHPQVAYLSYSPLPPNKSYDLLLNPIKIGSNPLAKSQKITSFGQLQMPEAKPWRASPRTWATFGSPSAASDVDVFEAMGKKAP